MEFEEDINGERMTAKRFLFCQYLIGECKYNATEAYKKAGFSEHGAQPNSSRLMALDTIKNTIAKLESDRLKRLQITADSILSDIKDIGDEAFKEKDYASALRAKDLLGRVELWKRAEGKTSAEVKANGAEIKITFDDKPDDPS